jgi:AAA+ superfamily predicted ATPase
LRLYLQGAPGSGKSQLAEAIAGAFDVRLVTVQANALAQQSNFDECLRLIFREVWLKGGVLYFAGTDALQGDETGRFSTLLQLLAADNGVTVMSGEKPWRAAEFESAGVIPLTFNMSAPALQIASWKNALARAGITLTESEITVLAGRFRLTPAQAIEAAAAAVNSVRWRNAAGEGGSSVLLNDVFSAARLQCGQELADLARRIEPKRGWTDIVLPEESMAQLQEICARIASHVTVLSAWGFGKRLSLGKGVTALFAGPSGTGKTLAAEIVAFELGLFLYKVDLSGVVSKYIGETEKNLDRVFTAARDANCVLFFDEADALFGKRSEVKDSHDRYANLEISYLLQKMEEFEGLAILATNLRQNLDEAFTRRLTFTVHFPFPDENERRRIWSDIWPDATPLAADVDAALLARELKMSGGNIKNTALAAAYYAATEGGVVTHAHVLRAARREFQKMGKIPANLEHAFVAGRS